MDEKQGWAALVRLLDREKISPYLIVMGVLLAALGGLGAWPYPHFPIAERGQNILLLVAALSFIAGAFFYFKVQPNTKFDFGKCKFETNNLGPIVRTHNSKFDMEGTYEENPPDGHKVVILELEGQGRFRPRKIVDLYEKRKSWKADAVWMGEPGTKRTIAIAIVGPSSLSLINYFEKVGKVYNYQNRPSIDELPPDIYICQQKTFVTQ